MTYQEKDLVLRQYRENAIRLRGLVQEAERWEQIAMSTAISGEPSGSGGTNGGGCRLRPRMRRTSCETSTGIWMESGKSGRRCGGWWMACRTADRK